VKLLEQLTIPVGEFFALFVDALMMLGLPASDFRQPVAHQWGRANGAKQRYRRANLSVPK
jgi:hypothetical protein